MGGWAAYYALACLSTSQTMFLTLLVAAVVVPQGGWSALPLPSLSQPAPAEVFDAGAAFGGHLELGPTRSAPAPTPTSFRLPISNLIELLEEDARRAGTELRCLRTAPPLLARGSEEGLARARALLEDLDRAGVRQQIELEITLTADGATPTRFTQRVRSGENVRFGTRETLGFLADFEVDVASGGGTADPIIGRVIVGERTEVRAWRMPDGAGVFVLGTLDLSELAGIDTLDPGSTDLGQLELPRVRSVVVQFAGAIQSGAALNVVVSGAPLERSEWTLSVRATTEPERSATWRVADIAWLESSPPETQFLTPGAGLLVRDHDDYGVSAIAPLSSAILWGELEASLGARRAERPLFSLAPGVVVAPAADQRVWGELDALLEAAQQSRAATRGLEVRAGALFVRTSIAEGIQLRVQSGEERTALIDFDTEIAPEYWLAEPRVARVFDGIMVQARLAGSELLGSWWESSSGAPRPLGRDETLHGRIGLPTRSFRSGPIRMALGTSADSAEGIRIDIAAR